MDGALKREPYYTYEDWLEIDDDNFYELIDGELYMMAPPNAHHQELVSEFMKPLLIFLTGKPCKVFPAPFGVRLYKNKVFLPDITVVCDKSQLGEQGCEGAPEFIIEILSLSTSDYDKFTKYYEYLRAGVLEYWIVDPIDKTVFACRLTNGVYVTDVYNSKSIAPVKTLPGCEIDLSQVFPVEAASHTA